MFGWKAFEGPKVVVCVFRFQMFWVFRCIGVKVRGSGFGSSGCQGFSFRVLVRGLGFRGQGFKFSVLRFANRICLG